MVVTVCGLGGAGSEGKCESESSVSGESTEKASKWSAVAGGWVTVGCLVLTTMVSSLLSNLLTSVDSSLIVTGPSENEVASVVWAGDCDLLPEASGLEDRADLHDCGIVASGSSGGEDAVSLSTNLCLLRERWPSSGEVIGVIDTFLRSTFTKSGSEIS